MSRTTAKPVDPNEFPKMLYRFPSQGVGVQQLQDGHYDTAIAANAEDQEAAEADDWHETTTGARAKSEDEAAATRAELEAKAKELGIEFNPRLGDKKLAALIEAKLKG